MIVPADERQEIGAAGFFRGGAFNQTAGKYLLFNERSYLRAVFSYQPISDN
jgi:hypothetical protein